MNVTSKLEICPAIRERWFINDKNILNSTSRADGYLVFKFCYNPETGEFLCDSWPENHKTIIGAYGKKSFNDYVRGIHFDQKKVVYLRQHQDERLLFRTMVFLREHGVPDSMRIVWGSDAAMELEEELKGL